jgi:hypothetical protein
VAAYYTTTSHWTFDDALYITQWHPCIAAQAQQPPYGLDARFAERALAVFRRAQAAYGVRLDESFWRTLLDCQVTSLSWQRWHAWHVLASDLIALPRIYSG